MSISSVSPTNQDPLSTRSLPSWVAYLIFVLGASLYLLPFMRIVLMNSNEGTLVDGAVRIIHGQVFARDFFEVMGPGTFYWLASFLKLFGVTFFAVRVCLFVTSLGTGLLIYYLTRRICTSYKTLPCILLVGTIYLMQWPAISHHLDSNFFALISVACLVVWIDKRWNSLLLMAGFCAGFTTCILQPKGILLLFAILVWLLVQRKRLVVPSSSLVFVAGGYFAVIGIMVAYFWSQSALSSLIYANVVWPSQSYSAANAVPYAFGIFDEYWKHWFVAKEGFRWTYGMAAVLITPFLFVAILPALLSILAVVYRRKVMTPEVALFLLCGGAFWISEYHRKDIYHLVFGSPLLVIVCIYFLVESRNKIADFAVQILAITATCLAVFNLLQAATEHSVQSRVGVVAMAKDDPILSFLDSNTYPGEEIFVYPFAPMYYFLSSTANPARYSILEYNYNTTAQFKEVIQVLDQRKVHYVLWDTNFEKKTARLVYPRCPQMPANLYLMEPYLESHYNQVLDVGGFLVMERKSEEDNAP